ncbi:HD domain-containing protein [Pseudonocardia sp.]|uniref:HD domain-containing protein n=1 Tax=Pseudonocardia sp. TaxID=60912 RepID=UPI00261C056A|nr:HD domain-containing protein [Pseudonocardia sp.]MCW2718148.1 metal-dependent phosphohydrolase [Pseudonocardia sp.]
MSDVVERLMLMFAGAGAAEYLGEDVSLATHMLAAGTLAMDAGAPDRLVVAALLHDVGHLTGAVSGAELMSGTDNHHDDAGATWLAGWFPPEVTEPVRQHVAAKRYLCAVDGDYLAGLSSASAFTLRLQGGPFDPAGVAAFEASPYARDAVAVRRWDDAAKDPAAVVRPLAIFLPLIDRVTRPAGPPGGRGAR